VACVNCSMPFGYANPYTPFGAGNVPQEMFKGRQEIVHGIMAPNGPAIIYGGRQLGKSAILRRVEDQFHDPRQDRYVYYDDIRDLGSPNSYQPPEVIWDRLRDWFVKQGLLSSKSWDSHYEFQSDIIRLFENNPKLKILVLLDEADKFLEADAVKVRSTKFFPSAFILKIWGREKILFRPPVAGLRPLTSGTGGGAAPGKRSGLDVAQVAW